MRNHESLETVRERKRKRVVLTNEENNSHIRLLQLVLRNVCNLLKKVLRNNLEKVVLVNVTKIIRFERIVCCAIKQHDMLFFLCI